MSEPHLDLFRQAILEQQVVACIYRGFRRQLCPHAIGWKDGRRRAIAFQFDGESSSGLRLGGEWKCIPLDEVHDSAVKPGPWRSAPDYARMLACFDVLELAVR